MTKHTTNPAADFYFSKDTKWQQELEQLRKIILGCGVTEVLKWGCPCYTHNERNIVLIHEFKEYCALLFFKGALLNDANGILVQQTKNVQAARQVRFTSVKEVLKLKAILKTYIYEAIEVENAGLKVVLKKPAEFEMAEEFKQHLDKYPAFPKQSKTREARVEKWVPQILKGKGLNDL